MMKISKRAYPDYNDPNNSPLYKKIYDEQDTFTTPQFNLFEVYYADDNKEDTIPYECPECEQLYNSGTDLLEHLKIDHKMRLKAMRAAAQMASDAHNRRIDQRDRKKIQEHEIAQRKEFYDRDTQTIERLKKIPPPSPGVYEFKINPEYPAYRMHDVPLLPIWSAKTKQIVSKSAGRIEIMGHNKTKDGKTNVMIKMDDGSYGEVRNWNMVAPMFLFTPIASSKADDVVVTDEDDPKHMRMDKHKEHTSPVSKELMDRVKTKKLMTFEKFNVWLVDGEMIRNNIDLDFTIGGNPGRYKYIPENEIWIEQNVPLNERNDVLAHELYECFLMERKHEDYGKAHDDANEFEHMLREKQMNKSAMVKTAITYDANQVIQELIKIPQIKAILDQQGSGYVDEVKVTTPSADVSMTQQKVQQDPKFKGIQIQQPSGSPFGHMYTYTDPQTHQPKQLDKIVRIDRVTDQWGTLVTILHEMAHHRHPEWSETQVEAEAQQLANSVKQYLGGGHNATAETNTRNVAFVKNSLHSVPSIKCDIADTYAKQVIGLQNHNKLSVERGMVFDYNRPQHLCFWMGKVSFPIDIIFADKNNKIIKIYHNCQPGSQDIYSCGDASRVIEVMGSFCAFHALDVGDRVFCADDDPYNKQEFVEYILETIRMAKLKEQKDLDMKDWNIKIVMRKEPDEAKFVKVDWDDKDYALKKADIIVNPDPILMSAAIKEMPLDKIVRHALLHILAGHKNEMNEKDEQRLITEKLFKEARLKQLNGALNSRTPFDVDEIIKIAISLEEAIKQFPDDKQIIDTLYNHDNTGNKALFNFVIKHKISDPKLNLQQFLDVVHAFQDNEFKNKLKKLNKPTDINAYKNKIPELMDVLKQAREVAYTTRQEKKKQKQINEEKIYETDRVVAYILNNKASVAQFSGSSNWCVTSWSTPMYENYAAQNTLFYLIVDKEGIFPNDKFLYTLSRDKSMGSFAYEEIGNSDQSIKDKGEVANMLGDVNVFETITLDSTKRPDTDYYVISKIQDKTKLEELSRSPDVGKRIAVALNQLTPSSTLYGLMEDPDTSVAISAISNNMVASAAIPRKLKTHPDEAVRFAVYKKTDDKKVLKTLVNSKIPEIRIEVLSAYFEKTHPDGSGETINTTDEDKEKLKDLLTPDVLREYAKDKDEYIRQLVARHPNTPEDALSILTDDDVARVAYSMIANPHVPPALLEKLWKRMGDADIDFSVQAEWAYYFAENPRTPKFILEDLIKHYDAGSVMDIVAMHPNTTPEMLDMLIDKEHFVAALSSPKLSSASVDKIIHINNIGPFIVAKAIMHPAITSQSLDYVVDLIKADGPRYPILTIEDIARNPKTWTHTLKKLMNTSIKRVRRAIAGNNNTNTEMLNELSKDPDDVTRLQVADHPNTSPEILDYLANDYTTKIRRAIARNDKTSLNTLEEMKIVEEDKNILRDIYKNIERRKQSKSANNKELNMEHSQRFSKIAQMMFTHEISDEEKAQAKKVIDMLSKTSLELTKWFENIENNMNVFKNYRGQEEKLVLIADKFEDVKAKQKTEYERMIKDIKTGIDVSKQVQDLEMKEMIDNLARASEAFTQIYNDFNNIPERIGEKGFIQGFIAASQKIIDKQDSFAEVLDHIIEYMQNNILGRQALT